VSSATTCPGGSGRTPVGSARSSRLRGFAGFGVDAGGEIYAVSLNGYLYRVGFRSA